MVIVWVGNIRVFSQVQQMASLLASLDSLEKEPKKKSKKEGKRMLKKEREAKKHNDDAASSR